MIELIFGSKLVGLAHDQFLGGRAERRNLLDLATQHGGVLVQSDGVQVDDAEYALVIVLYTHPIFERAQIISDVQIAGRLHSGKNSCFHGRGRE